MIVGGVGGLGYNIFNILKWVNLTKKYFFGRLIKIIILRYTGLALDSNFKSSLKKYFLAEFHPPFKMIKDGLPS